ncbi:uncharacterized protein LOC120353884 [Nilaparvata lugens]|uniref:uncharacterized protein LOC120353884 n=1 Tax=Nilaparvata lugens TaxID=108931 RepID=UPI00193D03AB|nr:uncharacterized protein LOC120353884 [Nilaparvata lugens]
MNGLFFTFLILPMLAYSSMFDSPVGPYWATFNRFEKCPKEGTKEMFFDFHLKKMNRSTVILYGNYSFKREFDDSIKLRNEFSLWGNGGWRSNAYNLDFDRNICKNFQAVLGKTFDMILNKFASNVQKNRCLFPIVSMPQFFQ